MTHIEKLEKQLQESGFRAKAWMDRRIYLNKYGRDIDAFIDMDDPLDECPAGDIWYGCALRVFSRADQSRQWLDNRRRQVKHSLMRDLASAGIVASPICKNWREVIL